MTQLENIVQSNYWTNCHCTYEVQIEEKFIMILV